MSQKRWRVGIVGSRDFEPISLVSVFVSCLESYTEVVSGGAIGVDLAAETAAQSRGMKVTVFLPDFKKHKTKYNVADFFKRNAEIVEYSDVIVAFWDGKSTGTQHSITLATSAGKRLKVFKPETTDQQIAEFARKLNKFMKETP